MSEEILTLLILTCLCILVILWVSIAFSLFYRSVRKAQLRLIETTFADIVSGYLYPNPSRPTSISQILQSLKSVGIKPRKQSNIQYLIRLMIRTQRSILGKNHSKLRELYSQIPPYKASYNKISSWSWYKKAQGIREIYEMDQSQYVEDIFKYRNHRNIYVRREAQIALVVFLGWESLRFLPYLKSKITLWQQIKIVEKLYDTYPTPELKWLKRAYKTDKPFGKKLLMRIIRKYELHSEINYILKHLNDKDYEIRETAIYCIQTFALARAQMEQVKLLYEDIPNATQQGQLLDYIYKNSEIDLEFYLKQLYGNNDELKLGISEILWNNGHKEKVQEFYYQQYSKVELNVG